MTPNTLLVQVSAHLENGRLTEAADGLLLLLTFELSDVHVAWARQLAAELTDARTTPDPVGEPRLIDKAAARMNTPEGRAELALMRRVGDTVTAWLTAGLDSQALESIVARTISEYQHPPKEG